MKLKNINAAAFTLLVSICLFFTACSKNESKPEDRFQADKTLLELPATAGKDSVFISSTVEWSLSNIPAWITIDPLSSSGDDMVRITYAANTNPQPRVDSFKINATGLPPITVKIVQAGASHYLITDSTTVSVDAGPWPLSGPPARDSVIINTSEPWGLIIPSQFSHWISAPVNLGTAGQYPVRLSIQSNLQNTKRQGYVKLYSRGVALDTLTITIKQDFTLEIIGATQSARGGDIIDIGGRGFSIYPYENEVKINGKTATVTQTSSTTLKAIVPDKAGSGLIEVVTGNKTATAPFSFIYKWVAVITDVAGSTDGYADGTGSNARFSHPAGLGLDAAGNLYVADYNNSKVRKITPAGGVTTLPGHPNSFGGTGNTEYALPSDVSVDPQGNVYVAETNASRISKITPSGTVSVFAGGYPYGYRDGNGTDALFYQPTGLYTDQNGNTFVAEGSGVPAGPGLGHHLRKITPSATVSTIAGGPIQGYADGTGTNALFNMPSSVAVDQAGNMYVSDLWNNKMRKVTPSGVVSTMQSNGQPYYLFRPTDVTIDENGLIYVGDSDNKIHRISITTGEILVLDEFRDQTTNNLVTLQGIYGIAAAGNGIVYIADYYNNKIRKITGLK